jgi:hypothetical protein
VPVPAAASSPAARAPPSSWDAPTQPWPHWPPAGCSASQWPQEPLLCQPPDPQAQATAAHRLPHSLSAADLAAVTHTHKPVREIIREGKGREKCP